MTEQKAFDCRLRRSEKIFAWIFLPIFSVGSGYILIFVYLNILEPMGVVWTGTEANMAIYLMSLMLVIVFMRRFLRSSFDVLLDDFGYTLSSAVSCYGLSILMNIGVNMLKIAVLGEELTVNPNQAAIEQMASLDFSKIVAMTVLMAPIVEECLFRGAVFGPLREKNRIAAWVVTIALFAFYHLWESFVYEYTPTLWLDLLDYVPAGVALCMCYEKSRNIWGPIILHVLSNSISVWAIHSIS